MPFKIKILLAILELKIWSKKSQKLTMVSDWSVLFHLVKYKKIMLTVLALQLSYGMKQLWKWLLN